MQWRRKCLELYPKTKRKTKSCIRHCTIDPSLTLSPPLMSTTKNAASHYLRIIGAHGGFITVQITLHCTLVMSLEMASGLPLHQGWGITLEWIFKDWRLCNNNEFNPHWMKFKPKLITTDERIFDSDIWCSHDLHMVAHYIVIFAVAMISI